MPKRYTFKLVLSGVGATIDEAKARAIDGFILDVGEFDVLKVEYLDENYEVCKHPEPDYGRIENDGNHCWRLITCTECGKKWNEVFIYSHKEEIEED